MHTSNNLILYGSGGHSKVVYEAFLSMNLNYKVRFVDDNKNKQKEIILNKFQINAPSIDNYNENNVFHICIGDNKKRHKIFMNICKANCNLINIIHLSSNISIFSSLGSGLFIAANSIIGPDCNLGDGVIINHGAIIDHDCSIGSFSHISPNSTLGGNVLVGDFVLIGSGSTVLPNVSVGDNCTIGSGSIVTKNVPKNSTIYGVI